MSDHPVPVSLPEKTFVEWLIREGQRRYHDHHPFHQLMHEGKLTKFQLQQWVLNRYYYQTRLPIKDALILAKADHDVSFRRRWVERIHQQDGKQEGEGGLTLWLQLAKGVGLDVDEVKSYQNILPGVRMACDHYVELVREMSLLEAVALSLTELFVPDLMSKRIAMWEEHYPWVDRNALVYFRTRVSRASLDCKDALEFVITHATTYDLQERCVKALIAKTQVLWHLLDCLSLAYIYQGSQAQDHSREPRE
jgi:pyrroloquinoline-quinone synthase